jgi:hypothetical protein
VNGVAKILSSLAWPAAAFFMVLMLRTEIARLLARLKRGKWGSAEFEFENELREIEHDVEIPATPEAEAVSPTTVELASQDPRGAILAAWLNVEMAMNNLVRVRGLGKDYTRIAKRPLTAIRLLQDAQALDSNYVALFHSLRTMRNEAAHSFDFKPDADAVIRYTQLANELVAEMQRKARVQTD